MATLRHRKANGAPTQPSPTFKENDSPEENKRRDENRQGVDADDGMHFHLVCQRSSLGRLDVGPFLISYATCIGIDQRFPTAQSISTLLFTVALVCHVVVVLGSVWSERWRAVVGYTNATHNQDASHCLVQEGTSGPSGIVAVQKTESALQVRFQDKVYRWALQKPDLDRSLWGDHSPQQQHDVSASNQGNFCSLFYPDAMPLSFFSTWTGHSTPKSAMTAAMVYGPHSTSVQLPALADLLQHQLSAPFFLFQVVCCGLWSLDEYWYYAVVTLGMLLLFETVTAYNRLQGLHRLHAVASQHAHQRVEVRRYPGAQWIRVARSELVPGDWIRLGGSGSSVPADIVLMEGSTVVDEALLTGESVPQLKQPLDVASLGPEQQQESLDLTSSDHKESILFGGTVLVTANLGGDAQGIVVRTGFATAQGSLLRTMAHGNHTVSASHQRDTAVFIATLFLCGIAAGVYVVTEAWADDRRNRFRLLLHVILLITSTVPPELPLELSLAVTHAVQALQKRCSVFCTEPNRIPVAGQVTVCCFDKTGTLTSDTMILQGIALSSDTVNDEALVTENLPTETLLVMAACHSLTGSLQQQIIGDPLEQAVFVPSGYRLFSREKVVHETLSPITIVHRYPFSSQLKRMSVVVAVNGECWVLTKGAPETIRDLITSKVPNNYAETAYHHMGRGRRVLAMACKKISVTKVKPDRAEVESSLAFAGFLVLQCPLKPDTKPVIRELHRSGHRTCMITGDALLTATEVARQVGIASRKQKSYEIRPRKSLLKNPTSLWSNFECVRMTFNEGAGDTPLNLADDFDELIGLKSKQQAFFCLTGDTLLAVAQATVGATTTEKQLLLKANLLPIVRLVSVYARHAPHHKEAVVAALNRAGERTLMCGDGTNDVGALKCAHVGISIISAPEIEAKQRAATSHLVDGKESKERTIQKTKKKKKAKNLEESLRQLREAQDELDHVELGDASVAAPFTSRALSIRCCKDVIQQGRCTLVTMLQIYKILGVNCLVNALVLSKLFLHGVKQGDRQLTVLGMGVAALFYFVTRAEPLSKLADIRPPSTVLCAQAFWSITGQCVIHLGTILLATDVALSFVDPYDPSLVPDGPFNPNVLNSCTFLLTCLAVSKFSFVAIAGLPLTSLCPANTFAVNYRGEPFMKSLRNNKLFYRSLMICYGSLFVCALEVFPPLNDLLQLTSLPSVHDVDEIALRGGLRSLIEATDFPVFFCGLMVLNTMLSFAYERTILNVL